IHDAGAWRRRRRCSTFLWFNSRLFGNSRIGSRVPEENGVQLQTYGRGAGVGRGRGVGAGLPGVAVGVGVADAVAVAVAVAVGVGLAPPWKLNLPIRVCQLKLPFVAWYSFTCQKVIPSDGSMVVML